MSDATSESEKLVPVDTPSFLARRKFLLEQLRQTVRELHFLYKSHALYNCQYPKGTKCQFLDAFGPVPAEIIECAYMAKAPFYQVKIRLLSEGTFTEKWVDDLKRLVFSKGKSNGR